MKVRQLELQGKNNASFGMALNMPLRQQTQRKVGNLLAEQAERARPILEELAKDVDITIIPHQSLNSSHRGFEIKVSELESKTSNFLKKLLSSRKKKFVMTVAYNWELDYKDNMANFMINTTKGLIKRFENLTNGNKAK